MKQRIIASYIREKKDSPLGRIIILTGARQTGKTTLTGICFPDYTYLSIEDPVQRTAYTKLTAQQWKRLYPKAILDEVQKEPVLIESIKSVYDQFPAPKYILLGSSQFLLMKKVRESLAGRCVIFEIYPLTLPELRTTDKDKAVIPSFFARYSNEKTEIETIFPAFTLDPDYAVKIEAYNFYLSFGGYPVLTHDSLNDKERREWISQYVKTFLERDIRDLASFRDLEPFLKLQHYLAYTTGNLVNYSSIAKETAVSVPTVKRYISYMELSYQIINLPAWFSNPVKRLVKSPKIHFMDTGILRNIIQKEGPLSGNEYESAIIAEIYKQIKSFGLPYKCYHFRTLDGREIDLLLETEDGFIAIEIKQTEHVNSRDAKNLRNLQDFLNKPLKQCFILSNDLETHYFEDNIIAMHAAAFLE